MEGVPDGGDGNGLGGGRDGRRVRWDWWDGVSLGDKLVGRLESWVAMCKNVNEPLSGTWTILLNWREPFWVDGCGTDAGERKDDNAMGSVAGITKGCGWAPFANLPSGGRPSGITIVRCRGVTKIHFVKTQSENCK